MQADDFLVIATSLYCPRDDNLTLSFEPKYLLNLPYLSEFIEPDIMTILKRINFLNQSIPVELPQLLIASKQYEAKLGIEQESKFDLQAIINQTLNDEITFDNLGHYLYNEVIKGHTHNRDFDILNGFDWAIIAAILVGLLAIALSVRLHFQVRTLFAVLSASSRARALEVELPTQLYFKTSETQTSTVPAVDYLQYHKVIKDVFPVDLTLLLCFIIFIIVVFVYMVKRLGRKTKGQTSLYLEIGNDTDSLSWPVMELGYPPNFYKIIVDQQAVNIRMISGFLCSQITWTTGVNVTNNILDIPVEMSDLITIKPWELSKARLIMTGSYYAVLQVVTKKEMIDVIVLQCRRLGTATSAAACPSYK